ncbi:hypothetical protein EON65_22835 [archaeon]|nr:MAG: hypothetical protein EON65_22835 [archaeon]
MQCLHDHRAIDIFTPQPSPQYSDMFSQGTKNTGNSGSGLTHYISSLIDPSLTWAAIAYLRSNTRLPIIVKGVLSAEDAALAVRHGCDGVWVSNHGARQLDTSPPTIEVLGEIVRAVKQACDNNTGPAGARKQVEVYLDGGILRGTDVFKALALGAQAVFLGRPILWGLAHSGEEGVYNVLKLINEELKLAMQLSGVTSIKVGICMCGVCMVTYVYLICYSI